MKIPFPSFVLFLSIGAALAIADEKNRQVAPQANPHIAPQADQMDPRVGKAGTIVKVSGTALSRASVEEVYLTDHRFDMKVKVLAQTDTGITFRVPPFVKPGRLQLLLLTGGQTPVLLEQPFYIQIDEGEAVELPAAQVEITKDKKETPNHKKTVEVASAGAQIPVPPASPVAANEVLNDTKPKPQPSAVAPVQQAPPQRAVAPAPVPAPETAAPAPAITKTTPAGILRRTRVAYPPAAHAAKIEGSVELIAIVRPDGKVKDVKVIRGNPYLVSAAMQSVREWLYEPARVNGTAVESEVPVTLNFRRP